MTNSFLSENRFRPQAAPRDTFVEPSTVAPTTGFDQLVNALVAVNPSLNALVDSRIKKEIKKEQAIGINQEVQRSLNDGTFGKLATSIQKKDGVDAAKELIGGSIFRRKAAERIRAKNVVLGLRTAFETEYNTPFDTGEVDADGNPIFKSINEFAPDSEEWSTWTQNILNRAFAGLEGVSPEMVAEHFTPAMQEQIFDITSHHIKQHKQFQFEDYIAETPKVINKGIELFLKDDIEGLKEHFNGHFQGLYKLGVTGPLAKRNNKDTLESYFAKADELIETGDKLSIKKARLLPQILAENTPYGPGGTKNLTEHPDYAEMSADHILKFNTKRVQSIKAKQELEEIDKKDEIEERMKEIWEMKVTNEKGEVDPELVKNQQDAFQKLLDENLEFAKEIQVWGVSDNNTLIARAAEIQNKMSTGFYGDNVKKALTDIQIIFSKHATLDTDAISLRTRLEEYAIVKMPKLGSLLKDNENEIMRPIDRLLGINVFGKVEEPEKQRQAIRYRRRVKNALENWIANYKDEDENPALPTQDEWRRKRSQYQDKLLVELGALTQQEFNQQHPNYEDDLLVDDPDKINKLGNQGNKDRQYGFKDESANQYSEGGSLLTQQQPQSSETQKDNQVTEKKEEESFVSITPDAYNKLDDSQKELYEPISNRRGRVVAYAPNEDEDFEFEGSGIRDFLEARKLKGLFGFETGKGNEEANRKLRTEVETTPIYDRSVLEQQINRLEELATKFPRGVNWKELSIEADFRLGRGELRRSEIDYKAINVLLDRTGLTPKEFFESQIKAHGLPMPTKLFDTLFPVKDTITTKEFNQLSNEEKQKYEFRLKKNNEQASSILDKGTLIAGELQAGMLGQKNNPKQELERQMLDVIHSGESTVDTKGGGYEAFNQGGAKGGEVVLGFSGTYGDHPANKGKKLVDMTIQEILDIQDSGYDLKKYPNTPEGQAKWEASGGIHAAGRYQFIRIGLREALKRSGIKPTEKFTPEIQDQLALTLLIELGPNQWTSMKGNKELKELLDKYKKTDWTKSSTIDKRSDIA